MVHGWTAAGKWKGFGMQGTALLKWLKVVLAMHSLSVLLSHVTEAWGCAPLAAAMLLRHGGVL